MFGGKSGGSGGGLFNLGGKKDDSSKSSGFGSGKLNFGGLGEKKGTEPKKSTGINLGGSANEDNKSQGLFSSSGTGGNLFSNTSKNNQN